MTFTALTTQSRITSSKKANSGKTPSRMKRSPVARSPVIRTSIQYRKIAFSLPQDLPWLVFINSKKCKEKADTPNAASTRYQRAVTGVKANLRNLADPFARETRARSTSTRKISTLRASTGRTLRSSEPSF